MDKKEDASKRDNPRISIGWMNEWMNELMQLHSIAVKMFLNLALKVNIGSELIAIANFTILFIFIQCVCEWILMNEDENSSEANVNS